jgi:hypothetical protein
MCKNHLFTSPCIPTVNCQTWDHKWGAIGFQSRKVWQARIKAAKSVFVDSLTPPDLETGSYEPIYTTI